jgi:hexokinase
MSMGKGFAISSKLDLAKQLLTGYNYSSSPNLPRIKIVAICNDAVATLVSFAYQLREDPRRKAAMGLIVGTGCNATIPLALSKLHPDKRPQNIKVFDAGHSTPDLKITVNTEWTIKGAAAPLHELNFITHWDKSLDDAGEVPGFQPFEYMTAGRYLGELGRLIVLDYFTSHLSIPTLSLPPKLLQRHGLSTTFLGNLGPHLSLTEPSIIKQLNTELPPNTTPDGFSWTLETADVLLRIAKAVQIRAAGMTAAAIIGLLACASELTLPYNPSTNGNSPSPSTAKQKPTPNPNPNTDIDELMVGYTGGCIVHFQDYLQDCQSFLDAITRREFGEGFMLRVVLMPCHDGGIIGAGILAGTVQGINADDE